MAARAHARIAAERARQREREDQEQEQYRRELEEETRAEREAGPPDGCGACYFWLAETPFGRPCWWHGESARPGPPPPQEPDSTLAPDTDESHWCWHGCHGDQPIFCGPIAFAAPG